jgi:hypothetical protein
VDDTSSNRPSFAGNTGDTSVKGDPADSVPDLEKAFRLAQLRVEIRETHSKDHQTMFVRNTLLVSVSSSALTCSSNATRADVNRAAYLLIQRLATCSMGTGLR